MNETKNLKCTSCNSDTEWTPMHQFCGECGVKLNTPELLAHENAKLRAENERLRNRLVEEMKNVEREGYRTGKTITGLRAEIVRGKARGMIAAFDEMAELLRPMIGEYRSVGWTDAMTVAWNLACQKRDACITDERELAGKAEIIEVKEKRTAELAEKHTDIDGVWFWQGKGNQPGSLSCPVVMSADTARGFAQADRELAELRAVAKLCGTGVPLRLRALLHLDQTAGKSGEKGGAK
jgi:hypothetical protein